MKLPLLFRTYPDTRLFPSGPALSLIAAITLALEPGQAAAQSGTGSSLAYATVRDATRNAGAVSIVDTTNNRVLATVPVGPGPNGMVVTSDEKRAYVVNYGTFPAPFAQATTLSDTVSVLQFETLNRDQNGQINLRPRVVATITVGLGPLGIAITPDNREVYISNFGQDPRLVPGGVAGNTVSVIETSSNKVISTIPVGKLPAGVAVTPDGKQAFVTCRGENQVWVIDTATHTVIRKIDVQNDPANLSFTPDGRRAYVTNFGSQSVSVINTATMTVLPVPGGVAIPVGMVPIGVTISPDGARAYVVNAFSNSVSIINTRTDSVITTVAVGMGPRAIAVTPDGSRAYVTSFMSNAITVLDTASYTVADTIPMLGGPNWVTVPR